MRAAGLAFDRPDRHCRLRVRGPGVVNLAGLSVGRISCLTSRRLNCDAAVSCGVASTSYKSVHLSRSETL